MKSMFSTVLLTAALLVSTTFGHSWLECVQDASNYKELHDDEQNGWLKPKCEGFPRNKTFNENWVKESTFYLWDLAGATATNEYGGRHACHPAQRESHYTDKAPMTTAAAGKTLRMRHWGNGHASWHWGRPLHRDPGLVRVYHGGFEEYSIMADKLTSDRIVGQANFSADAVTVPKEDNLPNDKANWFNFTVPKNIKSGRHLFIWTWAPLWDEFLGQWRDQYTTCFDINVTGGLESAGTTTPPPASDKPKSEVDPVVKERCAKKCNKGGMAIYPCEGGVGCPPCRYNENCFDKIDGKCPTWQGGFDCETFTSV